MVLLTIRHYLLLTVLFEIGFHLILGIRIRFMLSHGLDPTQIHLVALAYCVVSMVVEIPTGAIADTIGRRWMVVLSCMITAISQLVFAEVRTFHGFFLSEVIAGVGLACGSGAMQAWLVDQTKHHGYTGAFSHIYARQSLFIRYAGIVAAPVGAMLAPVRLGLPWLVASGLLLLCGVFAAFLMKEDYLDSLIQARVAERQSHDQAYTAKVGVFQVFRDFLLTLKKGTRYAATHPTVRFIMLLSFVQCLGIASPDQQYQDYFPTVLSGGKEMDAKKIDQILGFMWSGILITGSIGTGLATWLTKRYGYRNVMVSTQLLIAAGLTATVLQHNPYVTVAVYMLHEAMRSTWWPVKDAYLTEHASDSERATVNSCESAARSFGNAFGLVAGGLLIKLTSPTMSWAVMGTVLLVGTVIISCRTCRSVK